MEVKWNSYNIVLILKPNILIFVKVDMLWKKCLNTLSIRALSIVASESFISFSPLSLLKLVM